MPSVTRSLAMLGRALVSGPAPGQHWHVFANTAMASPAGIWEPGQEPVLPAPYEVRLEGRAILVLVAR